MSPATGGIKCTVIKHKHNVGSLGLLSDNGHDTSNDPGGARHTHKEAFVTMSYGIDSGLLGLCIMIAVATQEYCQKSANVFKMVIIMVENVSNP